jgi:hypothetical protein
MVMVAPPWILPFVSIFGLVSFQVAHYAWLFISLLLESVSAIALWRYFGGKKKQQWIALVLLATFLPSGTAEHMGQITPLILAGLTSFLFALRRELYLLAGACLLLVSLKPHLLYLVLVATLLWTVRTKRWPLVTGAMIVFAGSVTAVVFLNRNVLGYFHNAVPVAMDISCGVGGVLRSIFGLQHEWLQMLPTVIGAVWFAFYWARMRRGWTWEDRLPLLLLVSICTAPYFWAHDFILAIPALIALAVKIANARTDWVIATASYLLVQVLILDAGSISKAWMATASLLWLVLYCFHTRPERGMATPHASSQLLSSDSTA